jgi:hypothetical protein
MSAGARKIVSPEESWSEPATVTAQSLFNAILFVCLGFLLFTGLFLLITRILPGELWKRALEDGQLGPAILLAALALAVAMIVASAVH